MYIDYEQLKRKEPFIQENGIEKAKDIIDFLLRHNKNYTKKQYYAILELKDIIDCIKE